MKHTELDKLHNVILDLGLELKSFTKEQREFNGKMEARLTRLERQQMKTNLQLKQQNLSLMKISEKVDRVDHLEVRVAQVEKKLKIG